MKKQLWIVAALATGGMLFAQQQAPAEPGKGAGDAVAAAPQAVPVVMVEKKEVVLIPVAGPLPAGECPPACSDGSCEKPKNFAPPWYDVIYQLMILDIPIGSVMIKGWQLCTGALLVILLVVLMSRSSARKKAAAAAAAKAATESNPEESEKEQK